MILFTIFSEKKFHLFYKKVYPNQEITLTYKLALNSFKLPHIYNIN